MRGIVLGLISCGVAGRTTAEPVYRPLNESPAK